MIMILSHTSAEITMMWLVYLITLTFYVGKIQIATAGVVKVSLKPAKLLVQTGNSVVAKLCLSHPLSENATLVFSYDTGQQIFYTDKGGVISPVPNITLWNGSSGCTDLNITGVNPGHVFLGVNSTSGQFEDLYSEYIRVHVVHRSFLVTISAVIGWIYFVAWTIGSYPQLYLNWRRKSVVGISFDYLSYNYTSIIAYSLFNCGLYWLKTVQAEYFALHPRGINPVQLNDAIFSLHTFILFTFMIVQCFIYDSGTQKISKTCYIIHSLIILFCAITLLVAVEHKITWLTYLYYFSYIKLGITLFKYIPQVYTIYRQKTAEGFSMLTVLFDFTGGLFSVLQMFVLSYNSNDWGSIIGDPTKFGLGLFSMTFDVIFLVQNFCLYPSSPHQDEERTVLIN